MQAFEKYMKKSQLGGDSQMYAPQGGSPAQGADEYAPYAASSSGIGRAVAENDQTPQQDPDKVKKFQKGFAGVF